MAGCNHNKRKSGFAPDFISVTPNAKTQMKHFLPSFAGKKKKNILNLDSYSPLKVEVKVKSLSCVQLFATPWTVARQAPPSMGFSRQEYWSGLPMPSPGDLPHPGIKPMSPALRADALTSEPPGKPS